MGMSTSSTQLVFFIAAMVLASSLVALFAETISSMSDGVKTRGDDVYDKLMTDITIINDPNFMDNDPVIVYVKNTGQVKLSTVVDVLLDNQPQISNLNSTVMDGDEWDPGNILKVEIDTSLSSGEHTVKVISSNGESDLLSFRL